MNIYSFKFYFYCLTSIRAMGTTAKSYIQESLTDNYIYVDLNVGKVGALVIVVGM